MNNMLKFEFDFNEVFEGIKCGVIKQLSEMNFDNAKSEAINSIKSEVKNKIYLTYKNEDEIRNEIKNEIKEKVFEKFLTEAKSEYKKLYGDYFNGLISKQLDKVEEDVVLDIKKAVCKKLYDDLYSGIQYQLNNEVKKTISQLVNNLGGNNLKVKGTDNIITQEEYKNLLHRDEILTALEQGGVDNWEWYSESIHKYFGEEDDEEDDED